MFDDCNSVSATPEPRSAESTLIIRSHCCWRAKARSAFRISTSHRMSASAGTTLTTAVPVVEISGGSTEGCWAGAEQATSERTARGRTRKLMSSLGLMEHAVTERDHEETSTRALPQVKRLWE